MIKDNGIFQDTMVGLDTGLRVRNITTYELETCEPDADIAAVLLETRLDGFDCIPVRSDGVIVGYIKRAGHTQGTVRDHMYRLDESVLVTADLPLRQFVPLIPTGSHRLVLEGATIKGIVTWSDLQKLPIRLYVFSLVTHLEMVMADVIQTTCPNDEWTAMLKEGRQKKVEEKRQMFRRKNNEPPLIELTELCDKRDILARQFHLGNSFAQDLEAIGKLRDTTAHGGTYAEEPDAVSEFVRLLKQAEYWIGRLAAVGTGRNPDE